MSLFSYLVMFLGILFWLLRAMVCLFASMQQELAVVPMNLNLEIALLFASVPCFALIAKRNLIGATVFFGIYGAYFGTEIMNQVTSFSMNILTVAVDVIGILIPFFIFMDILLNKNGKKIGSTKKTDWFFDNAEFDREHDEREDRNQYKF